MEAIPTVLENRRIRRTRHNGEWWFAVEDVCGALMDSPDGAECWRQLRQSLEAEGCEVVTLCHGLQVPAPDGAVRRRACVTLEGVFRIVQSIASPRAEVLKRWLAQVGREEKRPQSRGSNLDTVFAMLEDAAVAAIASRRDRQEENCGDAAQMAARIVEEARRRGGGWKRK